MKEKLEKIIKENKIVKFILVGGTSTSIDFCIYMLLSKKIYIPVAKLISMITSCAFSFLLNRNWTFEDKSSKTSIQVIKYIFSQCINIVTNVLINQVIIWCTNNKIVAYVLATICAMIVNYFMQKKFVFKRRE